MEYVMPKALEKPKRVCIMVRVLECEDTPHKRA
jgi:hypothetical protein